MVFIIVIESARTLDVVQVNDADVQCDWCLPLMFLLSQLMWSLLVLLFLNCCSIAAVCFCSGGVRKSQNFCWYF